MKKTFMRTMSVLLTFLMIFGQMTSVLATGTDEPVDATTAETGARAGIDGAVETPEKTQDGDAAGAGTDAGAETGPGENVGTGEPSVPETPEENGAAGAGSGNGTDTEAAGQPQEPAGSSEAKPEDANTETKPEKDISGDITVDSEKDISGTITVEEDKNDDKVEIQKGDKPYLALGADLTPQQQATVLAIMGIDSAKLSDYDVVYVNNSEEHQYLNSYIDSSKIGSKSLSSVVIMERKDGNGINVSTNNISYCTVGMYKNALATAGIENADIIVAAPFAISGTAALVGVFKAYKEMTGDEVDEENIDAALHELVLTGSLESAGASSDEVENMMAYVKQAVVKHDLSDESEINDVIAEGCEKFGITLTEEEKGELVGLMQKISKLDLDWDKLINSAQSIYDKIMSADSGFWAKIKELLQSIIAKIKELF